MRVGIHTGLTVIGDADGKAGVFGETPNLAALAQLADAELVYVRGLPPEATYTLQARAGAGQGVRVAAEEPARGAAQRGGAVASACSA